MMVFLFIWFWNIFLFLLQQVLIWSTKYFSLRIDEGVGMECEEMMV